MPTASWFSSVPARASLTAEQREVLDELVRMLDHFEPDGVDPSRTSATIEEDGSLQIVLPHRNGRVRVALLVRKGAVVQLQVENVPPREWTVAVGDDREEPWPERTVDIVAGIIAGSIEREDRRWGRFVVASTLTLVTDGGSHHLLATTPRVRRIFAVGAPRVGRSIGFRGQGS